MKSQAGSWIPEAILSGAVCFGPLAFGAVEPWSQGVLLSLVFLLFAVYLREQAGRPIRLTACQRTLVPGTLLLLILGLFQLANPSPWPMPQNLAPFTVSTAATGQKILLLASYAALLWSASGILQDKKSISRFAWTLVLLGSFIALVGVMQRIQGNTHIYGLREAGPGRTPFGPYYNQNNAACLLAMSLLTGLGLLLGRFSSRARGRGGRRFSDFLAQQVILLSLLALTALGLIETASRGALLSVAVSSLLLAFALSRPFWDSLRRRKGLWLSFVPAAMALFWLFQKTSASFTFSLESRSDILGSSSLIRLSLYSSSLRMLADFPIWGAGLGSYEAMHPAYRQFLVPRSAQYAHSDWLQLGVEAGFFGCIILGCSIFALAAHARRTVAALPQGERSGICVGLAAAATAFMIHSLFEFNFQIPANAAVFLVLLAALGSGAREDASVHGLNFTLPRPAYACISFLAMALAMKSFFPAIAQAHADKAQYAPPAERPARLSRALAWHKSAEAREALSLSYLRLADDILSAKRLLLRHGLDHAAESLRASPLTRSHSRLAAAILSRTGRGADSEWVLHQGSWTIEEALPAGQRNRLWRDYASTTPLMDFLRQL